MMSPNKRRIPITPTKSTALHAKILPESPIADILLPELIRSDFAPQGTARVEEIHTIFTKGHCARATEQFWGYPPAPIAQIAERMTRRKTDPNKQRDQQTANK